MGNLIIFKQTDAGIEYLVVQPSKVCKEWSLPKGKFSLLLSNDQRDMNEKFIS